MGKTTVYLSDELLRSLENRTQRDDIKKSQVVQRALRNYFEQNVDEDALTIRQEQLESKVEDIEKIQDALLKNLNLKVKNRLEPEEVEKDDILLVGEDEDDETNPLLKNLFIIPRKFFMVFLILFQECFLSCPTLRFGIK